jgi:hypothetical protein
MSSHQSSWKRSSAKVKRANSHIKLRPLSPEIYIYQYLLRLQALPQAIDLLTLPHSTLLYYFHLPLLIPLHRVDLVFPHY